MLLFLHKKLVKTFLWYDLTDGQKQDQCVFEKRMAMHVYVYLKNLSGLHSAYSLIVLDERVNFFAPMHPITALCVCVYCIICV